MARKFIFGWSFTSFAFEPETIAYMNAIGIADDSTVYYPSTPQQITGNELWLAVNDFVLSIKSIGLSKFKAIYPIIGGTANRHKFNLINPLDFDSAYRVSFTGGWAHFSTGALPNGINAFGNTHLKPFSSGIIYNNNHVSYYSRTSIVGTSNSQFYEIGSGNTTGDNNLSLWTRRATDTAGYDSGNFPTNRQTASNTDGRGLYIGSANGSVAKLYKNGSEISSKILTPFTITDHDVYIGGFNEFLGTQFSSNKECSFASIGYGLSDVEVTLLNTAVQNLQIALNRQV